MADRYWVGGTANWDGTAGTKWSTTSGGAGGASVPTSVDDVFFTNLSTGTCTIATGNSGARSINCTGFAGTITGTAAITVAGSVTLVAGMTYTHTGTMTFVASGTLTTAGKTFSGVTVNAAGITLTLGDALNIDTRILTVTQGTFTTAGFSITGSGLVSSTTGVRTINLGASTLTLINGLNFSTSTNLTFNAGTSQINVTNSAVTFNGGSQTFHNVSFTTGGGAGVRGITGTNVFNNLSLTANVTGLSTLSLLNNQTVNGTFTCAGSSASARGFVISDTLGVARTITAAAISAADCDFRDITLAGAAAGAAPTRAGDCGGNSGITFPAAKTVYRVGTNTTWAGVNSWATGSGGAGADTNFPLAQDTAVIDNSTTLTGTLALGVVFNIGSLNASTRTTGITLDHSVLANRYGSYALGSGVTVSGTSTQTFFGRGTMDFTSAGKTITFIITVDSPGGTLRLLDATTSSNSFTLTRGTLNLNNLTFTLVSFASSNSNTRSIAFGTGNITVTGTATVWNMPAPTNFTLTGTPVVNVTNATASSTTVTTGTVTEANSISFNFTAGTYSLTLTGGSTAMRNLNFTGFSGNLTGGGRTIFGDLTLSTGMTLSTSGTITTFASTSATPRTINTNGRTIDFPLTFDGVGGTFRLLGALTMGSSRQLTHTNGTLDLNGFNLTVGTAYTTATGTKNLTFNGGTLTCPASFNNAVPTGFTTTAGTGIGTINMTSASAKSFIGGGSTYNCTVNNGGAGNMTVSGSNTITTLSNSVQPTTISFVAGTTQTISNWEIDGTAGNLVTIASSGAGTHTLSKLTGTVSADYLSISNSNATGGATWYAGANSTNGGGNTGWIFTAPPGPAPSNQSNFFLLLGDW